MPDDRDARLAELRRLRLGDILYPGNSGCAGARGGSGAPGPCQGEVTAAAMKHYRGPERPHRTGSSSATSTPPLEAAEPLTAADRAELARRRAKAAYWAEVSARQRAANGMVGW
ncbi:MAG: hypothetical protein JWP64_3600 [Pseudonocardia sp.]|uniref:hypothetical protein n=1 Tax=Pseudonocardia sp. TaxID=60912 RepID=UPI0026216916|nr:hypothetical protein [Pseudonocardia sp.]MCU1628651.1 hypothetical protein [Pseudonocardia sp.]